MTIRVEIPWSYLDKMIKNYLVAHGIDINREMRTWNKWENDHVTFVYEQDEDAPLTEQAQLQAKLSTRPSYLDGR